MKLTETDLAPDVLARAQAGYRAALATFYQTFSRPAYTLIRRIVRGPAADDLARAAEQYTDAAPKECRRAA